MRKLYQVGQWIVVIKTGKRYQVEIDYEDLVYVYGLKEPFADNEVKPA